jgi:hypothetical protein
MPTPFAAATQAAAATVAAVMGESFDYIPMTTPADRNARPVADPERDVVRGLAAVWGAPSARADSGPVRTPGVTAERPGHASSRPFVSLPRARLPYDVRRGDRLQRLASGELYQVAEVLPSAPGHVRLDLNLIQAGS